MKKMVKALAVISALALMVGSFVSCGGKDAGKGGTKNEKSAKELKPNPESDFKYTMTDDGQGVKILNYIGKNPKIIIPETIEGLPVLEVEKLAELDHEYGDLYWNSFLEEWLYHKNNVTITHISFPDSVRSTGSIGLIGMSLSNYDALEYIKFPAGIETHPNRDGVLSVTTGKRVLDSSIPSVESCDKLKTVIIPEGIKVLPNFAGCKSLKTITLPSTVEVIPHFCFNNCSSLEEIIIPESVTQITFDTKYDMGGLEDLRKSSAFEGTKFNLATQAKLKQLGYNGKF